MDNFGTSERLRRALLLKTGQTTSYVTGDDGDLEKGEPHRYYVLSTGQYSGTTNITINAKTDAHSNACVLDESTGLMWSRTVAATIGPASNGLIPWTTNASGEGIFTYATAANAASLSGYTDWRIPNRKELESIMDEGVTGSKPDATAFPSWPTQNVWTATTYLTDTTSARYVAFADGRVLSGPKTSNIACILVRGPV